MQIIDTIIKTLSDNKIMISTVLGIVMAIAKGASNEKAGAIVSKIQGAVDLVALMVSKLGDVLKLVSDLMANMIKSDGFLGKK